jgi:hypothetical protein
MQTLVGKVSLYSLKMLDLGRFYALQHTVKLLPDFHDPTSSLNVS